MPDTFLETTPLKDLIIMREELMSAGIVTVIENNFLKRLSTEIDSRVAACQRATGGYIQALSRP